VAYQREENAQAVAIEECRFSINEEGKPKNE
jgi:hypothetical protein